MHLSIRMSKLTALILTGLFFLSLVLFSRVVFATEKTKSIPKSSLKDLPIQNIFAKEGPAVEAVADSLEYDKDKKKVIAKGNVVITHEYVKITSDYAEVETDTKKAYARGHVIVFKNDVPAARGQEITYDFDADSGTFPEGRMFNYMWFSYGRDIQQIKKDVTVIKQGAITTCDYENPHYEIRAKKITIISKDKMVAKNVTIYVLGKPVFWWPYMVIPLQHNTLPFSIRSGYNSRFGAYLEISKGFSVNESISGKFHTDWRSKRGFGGGIDLNYKFDKHTIGSIKSYWTQDERAPTPGAPDPFGQLEERDRGRLTWKHRTDFNPDTYFLLRYNRIDDEFFLQEFFEQEYRSDIQPQSFVNLTKNSERYGFYTHVEKRMNRFEALVERLPEVRFDWKNQPFIQPWLTYQSQLSYANLAKRFGRSDNNEDVNRFDNFNEWSVPVNWNEAKLTPFVNARGTFYSREKDSSDAQFRTAMGYGADLRTQAYKTFSATFDKWGIEVNGLRHVFEPSIRYDSVLHSSVSNETLNEFDPIDRVDNFDVVTFGIENRLQTKRVINGRMQRVDLVSLNTFLSYEIHPDGFARASNFARIDDGRTASNLTILNQEIVLRPYDWLQAETRFDYDMEGGSLRVFNQDILLRMKRARLLFGHRFTNDIGGLEGNNQFVFDGKFVLNELWQFGGYIRWDADSNGLDEWQIGATRDLHDFILDFGYNVRNSSLDSSNKEIYFNFSMKAFPVLSYGSGRRASFSEPRIGETVAGASQTAPSQTYYEGR